MVSARRKYAHDARPPGPRSTVSWSPACGSLSRARAAGARTDPPCGLSPYASASISTTVDLPEPFSPTSTVIPGPSSSPSRSSCAAAGTVAGQRSPSASAPLGAGRKARTSRRSLVQSPRSLTRSSSPKLSPPA